jgi:glycosyltransferase involved in cell wall biosynthesis
VQTASPLDAGEPFVPLTIHWLVTEPFAGSGGHIGIFRMIRHLVEFGHICHVHTIPVNFMQGYTPAQIEQYVTSHFMPTGAIFHQWRGEIGPADATVATYWKTVPLLLKLPLPGRRYYLVQDFEPYFYPVGAEYIQAEATYRQGLHCLTLGPWLAKLMREQYGAEADHFDFAVDTDLYMPLPEPRPEHPRIAFYARPSTPRRAYELGLEALHLVKQRNPGIEIIFYGAQTVPPPPFPVTNAGIVNPWELSKLFSTCDIGLVFSTTNPSFVPLEMMACRCAVVDLASERVAGLLEDGVNCRLAEPTPEAIANTLLDLVWDREQRAALVERAYQQVKGMSWRRSARQLEAALLRHAPAREQRVAYRAAGSDDIDMLAWQIHQLLDAGGADAALADALRDVLYRTLAEKAALVQQVQQIEQQYAAARHNGPAAGARTALQPLSDRLLDGAPAWMLGRALVSKLALEGEPLCQTFCADRSHLRRIELRLARRFAVHTGTLRVSLYEGSQSGRLVASELLRVAELPLDAPYAIAFTPEVHSYGKQYTVCIAAGETGQQSPAIWHFVQAQLAGANLLRAGKPLHGQIAIQPFFGEHPPLLPPRQGPAAWDAAVQLAPTVARAVVSQRSRALGDLAGKARTALRQRGVAGLGRDVLQYIEWQINQRSQS